MIRAFLVILCFSLALGACTQRTVCPAFQSAFIYDKDALRKKFSYFENDTTPKVFTASKNKYLIAEAMPYRKKISSMATVEMKDVNPMLPDSLSGEEEDVSLAELDSAARSIIDSTYVVDVNRQKDTVATAEDSVYVITKDKEVRVLRFNPDSIHYHVDEVRYNIDQDNYMWYLRDALVLPDVRLAQIQGAEKEKEAKKAKKGIKGFFKNLFKKKEKKPKEEAADTTSVETPVERSEFDFDYNENEDQTQTQQPVETKQKKGLLSFLKKKDKTSAKTSDSEQPAEKPPKPKKEKKPKVKKEEPTEESPEEQPEQKDDGF